MADRIIKGDSGNDVVIQNDAGSRKIEVTNSGDVEITGDVKTTTVKATNLKANDGTAGLVVADSTGEVTGSGGLKAVNVKATNLKANDGTAALVIADSTGRVTASEKFLTDDIIEKTSDHGVEIEGVTLKDSQIISGTLSSDVAFATDNKNNNKSVSLVKTTGGAFDFPTTATELYNSDNSFRLTLPSVAGTYLILSTLRVRHLATTHDSLKVTLHTVGSSATNGAEAVSNSKRLLLEQTVKTDPDARTVNVCCSLNWVITGSSGQILTLYGQCDTASLGGVFIDSAGFCSMSAIRLGD